MSESSAERLLQRWRPYDSRRLTPRELRIEALVAGAFVAVAVLLPVLVAPGRDFDPGVAAALIVSLALASQVRLHVGAGSAVPTQLVFVPMLFLLPPAMVPACVAAASLLAQAVNVLRRSEHPDRFVAELADCWYAVAPSLVFVAAGTPSAALGEWWVLALALTAQCATDLRQRHAARVARPGHRAGRPAARDRQRLPRRPVPDPGGARDRDGG